MSTSKNQSAGLLLFRRTREGVELLLGHPGGPYWQRRHDGAWGIPKGLIVPAEEPLSAARREFEEETGHRPAGKFHSLGHAKQPGGKIVHAWAVEGNWDPVDLRSNVFEMEWPPKSGKTQSFPEIDRAAWFSVADARQKILKGQSLFIDRLLEAIKVETR